MLKEHEQIRELPPLGGMHSGTNFLIAKQGPYNLVAVFEDDGATGYLYVFSQAEGRILEYVHIYDRKEGVDPVAPDVEVHWASKARKCGAVVWGKMRGIIDLCKERPGRVWLENRNTPGIGDPEWLEGFPQLLT